MEPNTPPQNEPVSIRDAVLRRIQSGEQPMRPRSYFAIRIVALVALVFAILAVSIFIVNFIAFSIRINSHDELLHFGYRGFALFIRFFPWPLLILDLVLIFFMQRLLRHFRLGYRNSILFFFAIFAILIAVAGFAIDRDTGVNEMLLHHDDRHELPPGIDGFFRGARLPPPADSGICRCHIVSMSGNVLTAIDVDSSHALASTTRTIILDPHEPLLGSLHIGDSIFTIGDRIPGTTTLRAIGIRKLPPYPGAPPPQ